MADGPVVVESLDGIPEALHSHFAKVEADGVARYEYKPPREDVSGLKSAKSKIEREAERLKAELKAMQDRYAIDGELPDPEEFRALVEAHKARADKELIPRTEAEKEKAALREKIQAAAKKELEVRETEIGELRATLERVLIDEGIARAAQDASLPFKLRKGAAELLNKLARADKAFRVIDGKPVPMEGDKPMETSDGNPASLLDWVVAKANHYGLVEESQGTGSAPPLNGSMQRKRKSEMSMDEKITFIKTYGEDKYAALPQ